MHTCKPICACYLSHAWKVIFSQKGLVHRIFFFQSFVYVYERHLWIMRYNMSIAYRRCWLRWPEGHPKRKIGFVGFLPVCFQFRYFFENPAAGNWRYNKFNMLRVNKIHSKAAIETLSTEIILIILFRLGLSHRLVGPNSSFFFFCLWPGAGLAALFHSVWMAAKMSHTTVPTAVVTLAAIDECSDWDHCILPRIWTVVYVVLCMLIVF